jgi:hypothetical protein
MRSRRSFAGIGLLICTVAGFGLGAKLLAAGAALVKATPDQVAQFSGTYRYAGNAQEEEARKAAIDHAVEGMSFLIRSAARSRITATTQILSLYSFFLEPGKIRIRPQSRPEMISGDHGEPADYVYNGKRSKLTQVFAEDRITQVFVSDDGKRQNEYTFSEEGKVMTLKVTLSSPRLTNPVVYSLSYKRAN